jgi:hypothetical protein
MLEEAFVVDRGFGTKWNGLVFLDTRIFRCSVDGCPCWERESVGFVRVRAIFCGDC